MSNYIIDSYEKIIKAVCISTWNNIKLPIEHLTDEQLSKLFSKTQLYYINQHLYINSSASKNIL